MNNGKIKHKSTKSAPQSLLYLCQKLPRCSIAARRRGEEKGLSGFRAAYWIRCLPAGRRRLTIRRVYSYRIQEEGTEIEKGTEDILGA